jgi:hypothetical protein
MAQMIVGSAAAIQIAVREYLDYRRGAATAAPT